jgi:thiosulfate/3-mercaptopyruvate sulfurtransferase
MLKKLGFLPIISLLQALIAAHASTLPGALVDATWLHAHLGEVQVLDVRDDLNTLTDPPKYKTVGGAKVLSQVGGYIPGALSANFWALRVKRPIGGKDVDFLLPSAAEFEEVMQASQLEPGKPVVVAPTGDDATSLQEAALLVWELELYGMPANQVAMLDGGTHAWIAAGLEVDDDAIAPMSSGHWKAAPARTDMMADTAQVRAALRAHRPLLDARPLAQFAAVDHTPVVPVAARLPGALPLPAELLYTRGADGAWRFLSAPQYRAVLALDRVRLPARPIVYCNTGQYAAGAWFVLDRILHRHGVREYQGGMNEWVARGLPVVGL